jgi:hypothetical protein
MLLSIDVEIVEKPHQFIRSVILDVKYLTRSARGQACDPVLQAIRSKR